MQFQVPQFIETEDKIVGPLSLRQFLYIGGATGISILLFFTLNMWLWLLLSLVVVGGGVALAMVKINGQSLVKVMLAAAQFYWKPQLYVWQPKNPTLPKNEETLSEEASRGGFSMENIIAGMALKSAWRQVQTGSRAAAEVAEVGTRRAKEKYEIIRRLTGERKAARRVDYR